MELMVIENDPVKAFQYEQCGVDRIFIDLEILGKEERQGHLNTVISRHSLSDIALVKKAISKSKILVRVNPINPDSESEINKAIELGADILMLPMFKTKLEVETFIRMVNKRVRTNLLLETPEAAQYIDEILALTGINEIHIGLNDMHLALGLSMMMEMYLGDFLEKLTTKIRAKNISLGIGGIAPLDAGLISGKLVSAEAIRLGCERFILSRAFPKNDLNLFKKNLEDLKAYSLEVLQWSSEKKLANRTKLESEIIKNRTVRL